MGKKMRITIYNSEDQRGSVRSNMSVEELPEDDQVRVGFEKGTLLKATFELSFGGKVVYELESRDTPDPRTALRRNMDD